MTEASLMEHVEILITVKAAPEIGRQHGETVCVAGVRVGVLQQPSWIRLFPIRWQWFTENRHPKYELIELDVRKHETDPRPESYRPDLDSVRTVKRLKSWPARSEIVDALPRHTMCDLVDEKGWERTSLAVVRPAEVLDFDSEFTGDTPEHRDKQLRALQGDLLAQDRPSLELCPWTFRYRYRCEAARCAGRHRQTIVDWELSEAWRRWHIEYPDDYLARLKQKWLGELCSPERGPEFFVGNQKNAPQAFMVLGVYRSNRPATKHGSNASTRGPHER